MLLNKIPLINVDAKIASKTLTKRLKPKLPMLLQCNVLHGCTTVGVFWPIYPSNPFGHAHVKLWLVVDCWRCKKWWNSWIHQTCENVRHSFCHWLWKTVPVFGSNVFFRSAIFYSMDLYFAFKYIKLFYQRWFYILQFCTLRVKQPLFLQIMLSGSRAP